MRFASSILLAALSLAACRRDAGPQAATVPPQAAMVAPLPSLSVPGLPERPEALPIVPDAPPVPLEPLPTLGVVPLSDDGFVDLAIPDVDTVAAAIARAREAVPTGGPGDPEKWRHVPLDRSGRPDATISVGNATTGTLVRGRPMPPSGPGFRVREATRTRGFFYGTDGLVGLLERAAATVARAHLGSVLLIGNLSREGGGDIPPSVSHNSGRDVDVGFYLDDRLGRPFAPGDDYVTFDADGASPDQQIYFDSARNWDFVAAVLTEPSVQVQYVFVADWLKDLLMDYAIRSGADPDLIVRADQVLKQPDNSSPHAEHFHIRIYCDVADRLAGCHDEGPAWAWIQRFDDVVQARIDALIDLYQTGDPEKRDYVRRQLDLLTVVPLSSPETGEDVGDL